MHETSIEEINEFIVKSAELFSLSEKETFEYGSMVRLHYQVVGDPPEVIGVEDAALLAYVTFASQSVSELPEFVKSDLETIFKTALLMGMGMGVHLERERRGR